MEKISILPGQASLLSDHLTYFKKPRLTKHWTKVEDDKVIEHVKLNGMINWPTLENRTGKQCRERWLNQLNPILNKTKWTVEEDKVLYDLHSKLGNKWSKIAKHLPGRSDNAIKNHYNVLNYQPLIKKKSLPSLKNNQVEILITNNQIFENNTNENSIYDYEFVTSMIHDDPQLLNNLSLDQTLFESLIQTPKKNDENNTCSTPLKSDKRILNQNASFTSSSNSSFDNRLKVLRTPTPLKNAINKIKLLETQQEKLRVKSIALNSQFGEIGNTKLIQNCNCNCHCNAIPLQI